MPPQGAAAAPASGDPFAALPHALVLAIFSHLTVEQRLRCIEVCRGWRATLADHAAWLQLDLTRVDGGLCTEALLRAVTSRAGGQLRSLYNGLYLAYDGRFLHDSLCAVAAANAATLQELNLSAPVDDFFSERSVRDLETPFGPLRVRLLRVNACAATADAFLALAADLAAHASLTGAHLWNAPFHAPGALDAVVDAALEQGLSSVQLNGCRLWPASPAAPALARLLSGTTLTELYVDNTCAPLLDAPGATLVANALRAHTALTALSLSGIELWCDAAAAAALMGALTAHPRLRLLDLSINEPRRYGGVHAAEAGAAVAALLLANAPALQTLDIRWCRLGDAGMGPVVEALRHNTHLTKLNCAHNDISEAFSRERLLSAVRANMSLRELVAMEEDEDDEEGWYVAEREAEALVAARVRLQLQ
jgi:hypothetical protein